MVKLRLGDGRQTWEPSRRQIGVSYAHGGSDTSEPGHFRFVVDRAKLRHYLNAIAPYVRRRPKNASVVVAVQTPRTTAQRRFRHASCPGGTAPRLT